MNMEAATLCRTFLGRDHFWAIVNIVESLLVFCAELMLCVRNEIISASS